MANTAASKAALKVSRSILNVFFNIVFYAVIVLLIVRASTIAYDFAYQVFGSIARDEIPGFDVEIQIVENESVYSVAQKLETKEIIVNKFSFFVRAKLMQRAIVPGIFVLNTSMDYADIMNIITDPAKSIEEDQNDS